MAKKNVQNIIKKKNNKSKKNTKSIESKKQKVEKISQLVTVISKNDQGYLVKREVDFNNRQTFKKIVNDDMKKLLYKLSEKPIVKKKIIIQKEIHKKRK